ncbi:hypothetical protein BU14_0403s0002 [Porphyra umbilicalis]|uniref:Uncharacterized protein n=1 Tax=Porphyra umbilicalis TaxID=2786 RepID=A0A1X6NW01_PORUM|nr:hypothetical protein BU14_0403s0002 [Porphyra umbilicalis]|eukprot:OSX72799.1 hypothetical protein BU14_0403s0002 [Porphyra umbilicalis]
MPADLQGTTRTIRIARVFVLRMGIVIGLLVLVPLCACADCLTAKVAGDAASPAGRPTGNGAEAAQATAQLEEGASALSDGAQATAQGAVKGGADGCYGCFG